jgi:hypothetical protein
VVTAADPGREFAFSRTEKFTGTIVWRYRLEREGDGTRVTESYDVVKPVTRFGWFVIGRLFGGHDRRSDLALRHAGDPAASRRGRRAA